FATGTPASISAPRHMSPLMPEEQSKYAIIKTPPPKIKGKSLNFELDYIIYLSLKYAEIEG
ncbi:MAG: hypothetical protein Q8M34_05515, partial [Thermodesulfovibrionales bacterium]|nr:hypothetical protein [Thermodesulfovibrionales bacterium]